MICISRSAGALRRQVSVQCRKSLKVDRAMIYFEMGAREIEILTAIFNAVILTQIKEQHVLYCYNMLHTKFHVKRCSHIRDIK